MKHKLMGLSLGIGAMLLATHHAFAQGAQNCTERAQLVQHLEGRWGESRQAIGISNNNTVVEMFASRDTGTWTIIVTMADGITCLVASGQAYEASDAAHPGTEG